MARPVKFSGGGDTSFNFGANVVRKPRAKKGGKGKKSGGKGGGS